MATTLRGSFGLTNGLRMHTQLQTYPHLYAHIYEHVQIYIQIRSHIQYIYRHSNAYIYKHEYLQFNDVAQLTPNGIQGWQHKYIYIYLYIYIYASVPASKRIYIYSFIKHGKLCLQKCLNRNQRREAQEIICNTFKVQFSMQGNAY